MNWFNKRKTIVGWSINEVIFKAKLFLGSEEGDMWKVKKPLYVSWSNKFKIVLERKSVSYQKEEKVQRTTQTTT